MRFPSRSRRGFALLMVLIVFVVMAIILGKTMFANDPKTHVAEAIREIDSAKSATCAINRNAVATDMTYWQINHSGEAMSPQALNDLVGNHICPGGGVYLMDKQGKIYCTLHDPAPASAMKDIVKLVEPTPTPTPISSNTLPPDVAAAAAAAEAARTNKPAGAAPPVSTPAPAVTPAR